MSSSFMQEGVPVSCSFCYQHFPSNQIVEHCKSCPCRGLSAKANLQASGSARTLPRPSFSSAESSADQSERSDERVARPRQETGTSSRKLIFSSHSTLQQVISGMRGPSYSSPQQGTSAPPRQAPAEASSDESSDRDGYYGQIPKAGLLQGSRPSVKGVGAIQHGPPLFMNVFRPQNRQGQGNPDGLDGPMGSHSETMSRTDDSDNGDSEDTDEMASYVSNQLRDSSRAPQKSAPTSAQTQAQQPSASTSALGGRIEGGSQIPRVQQQQQQQQQQQRQQQSPPPTNEVDNRVPCSICGRRFAPDRIGKHMEACQKMSKKPRQRFDVAEMRTKAIETANSIAEGERGVHRAEPTRDQVVKKEKDAARARLKNRWHPIVDPQAEEQFNNLMHANPNDVLLHAPKPNFTSSYNPSASGDDSQGTGGNNMNDPSVAFSSKPKTARTPPKRTEDSDESLSGSQQRVNTSQRGDSHDNLDDRGSPNTTGSPGRVVTQAAGQTSSGERAKADDTTQFTKRTEPVRNSPKVTEQQRGRSGKGEIPETQQRRRKRRTETRHQNSVSSSHSYSSPSESSSSDDESSSLPRNGGGPSTKASTHRRGGGNTEHRHRTHHKHRSTRQSTSKVAYDEPRRTSTAGASSTHRSRSRHYTASHTSSGRHIRNPDEQEQATTQYRQPQPQWTALSGTGRQQLYYSPHGGYNQPAGQRPSSLPPPVFAQPPSVTNFCIQCGNRFVPNAQYCAVCGQRRVSYADAGVPSLPSLPYQSANEGPVGGGRGDDNRPGRYSVGREGYGNYY